MQTFLFINRSSVNSSALCWGHRNRGANWKVAGVGRSPSAARLCSASVRMASTTAAATVDPLTCPASLLLSFWGLCLQLASSSKPKTENHFSDCTHVVVHSTDSPVDVVHFDPLRMFTLKKWQMFWKHLIQIKQTEKDFVCDLCCDVTSAFFFLQFPCQLHFFCFYRVLPFLF